VLLGNKLEAKNVSFLSKSEFEYIFVRERIKVTIPRSKVERVIGILEQLKKPSHYSEVARIYNEVYLDDISAEHTIHAFLSKQTHGVVWVGVRGTYAMDHWGFTRPKKDLYETVTEIVCNLYKKTKKAVPIELIRIEIGKYRQLITQNSFMMSLTFNNEIKSAGKGFYLPASVKSEKEGEKDQINAIEDQKISDILDSFT
jgi:hypothetical protein